MLLIFDLDDTLIETTTFLTARKLKQALIKMVEAGLSVRDMVKAQEMLLRMNLGATGTRDLLKEFVELYGGQETHFKLGMEQIEKVDLDQFDIEPDSDVIDLLEELKERFLLALVTRGKEKMQREKLRVYGLDDALFCEVVVTPIFDKGVHYKRIAKKLNVNPQEVVVIGDRIDADLADAKRLSMATVHIRRGRGANYEYKGEIVDHTIYELSELRGILETQENLLEMV